MNSPPSGLPTNTRQNAQLIPLDRSADVMDLRDSEYARHPDHRQLHPNITSDERRLGMPWTKSPTRALGEIPGQ
ncbi:MAG: hypothetical protein IPI20_18640 [Rhodoferax sp.]|nr:hypothetical protein [Rhodoferax sp.]